MTDSLPALLISIPEGVIDLGWGHPSSRLHPLQAVQQAATHMMTHTGVAALQYGAEQGFGPLLESLAAFLSQPDAYSRILAVEDDDLMLEYLSSALDAERFTVDSAPTCEEAMRRVLFHDYSVILMDLILPDGNGLQLFRQIARRRPAIQSRIIFVTGALSRREARRFSKLVDNPLILKPFRLEDLITAVRRIESRN